MRTRLVLYAEGSGETSGDLRLHVPPGGHVTEDALGAAHILVRRAFAAVKGVPEDAIEFMEGLRTATGRVARGSDLYGNGKTLRQLLAFVRFRPDGIVVLVDEDGDRQRLRTLRDWAQAHGSTVIAVARPEFEAWLLACHEVAARAIGRTLPTPPDPESHDRGAAKALFAEWTADHEDPGAVRRAIVAGCDLDALARSCPSFADLREELRRLPVR